ncbi:MAG: glucuronate isomerase [Marinoscillum sp.]|uniref:glucuronate isomerase n=1 Tax=Marinoscillum sp. TaxID=2024838 RepID=UPI003301D71B
MKEFLGEDFLLETKTAQKLYHDYAAQMPIIDYHCHLSPKDIAEDRVFNNLTEAWLEGDHYKWRAMRTNGVDESFVTGNKTPEEKFGQWASTVPDTLRNPLYHWTHLELQRYFDIKDILNTATSQQVYQQASAKLNSSGFSVRGLMAKMNVEVVCTTDDPISELEYHLQLQQEGFPIKVLPTFRPDNLYAVENPEAYKSYLKKLEGLVGFSISSFEDLLKASQQRIDFFHQVGGRLSDHGLEQLYEFGKADASELFDLILSGETLSGYQIQQFKMALLVELSKMYHAKGWTQQFHLGAIRNNNTRMMRTLGPDTGFDSIGDFSQVKAISRFLDQLDNTDQLAKTILYNLNPADNEAMATMIGNFNDGSVAGKLQYGSAWWFLDQKDGMEKQMNALSNMGLLSRFVGMLTDSRSFLSFPRHEYFRRILCNMIGKDVENGELPNDLEWLGAQVQNICYHNAKNYFNF